MGDGVYAGESAAVSSWRLTTDPADTTQPASRRSGEAYWPSPGSGVPAPGMPAGEKQYSTTVRAKGSVG